MQRILVVGPCGAGKSTLATRLAEQLNLPLIHMDQLNWRSGWVESSKAVIAQRLSEVTAQDRWIIDGTYGGTLDMRLMRADTVLYLDYPIRLCMLRLLRRIWHYRGRTRPDMTDGCPERFDMGFSWYALRWNSGPRRRLEQHLAEHEAKTIRFADPAALDRWFADLPA
jgi:adenylate kinase family enzyme